MPFNETNHKGPAQTYAGSSCAFSIGVACFIALAVYNCLELNVIILTSFRRHRGLYFWVCMITAWGIFVNAGAMFLKFFEFLNKPMVTVTFQVLGWYAMINGFSLVLWSRLHLVLRSRSQLRRVLYLIIFNAVVFQTLVTPFDYGSNTPPPGNEVFIHGYMIVEKIQLSVFTLQETFISCIYIYNTYRFLRPLASLTHKKTIQVLRQLIAVQVCVILMDATILAIEYRNIYSMQVSYKAFAYSMKLKLEFAILNQLVSVVTTPLSSEAHQPENNSNSNPNSVSRSTSYYSSKQTNAPRPRRTVSQPPMYSSVPLAPVRPQRAMTRDAYSFRTHQTPSTNTRPSVSNVRGFSSTATTTRAAAACSSSPNGVRSSGSGVDEEYGEAMRDLLSRTGSFAASDSSKRSSSSSRAFPELANGDEEK